MIISNVKSLFKVFPLCNQNLLVADDNCMKVILRGTKNCESMTWIVSLKFVNILKSLT